MTAASRMLARYRAWSARRETLSVVEDDPVASVSAPGPNQTVTATGARPRAFEGRSHLISVQTPAAVAAQL